MPGLNVTGQANTDDYSLGRGRLYLADLTSGLPGDSGWRDLGNCPEFNCNLEVETLEHQSSRQGLKVTDKQVVISQTLNISFSLDEINFQNLALFFSGTSAAAALTNPTIAGVAETTLVTTAPDYTAVGGRWYDLTNAAGTVRAYDIATANLTLNSDTGGDDNVLVENTDYILDEKLGRVFLIGGGSIDPGDDITFTLSADAGAVNPDEVKALTQTNVVAALKFVAENPANNDAVTEYQFHQVTLKAEGDFALIGDEFTTMGFTAVAESNTTADADSPTLTIRTHANA